MRVDDKFRKSVVFIGLENENGFLPLGTAFLGLVIYEDMGNVVLITADHVLDDVVGDYIWARVNRKDGTCSTIKLEKSRKIWFKDRQIDLAVIPCGLDPTIFDIWVFPLDSHNWTELVTHYKGFGPGDEISVIGLYTTHYGHIRNAPIVRIGHIASLPEEKIMTDRGYADGYLIEVHSIAGLSGSPVFWNVPPVRFIENTMYHIENPTFIPLGILIGHHVIETQKDDIVVPKFHTVADDRETEENEDRKNEERRTGFGVVLPIQRIFELFESDEMQKILKGNVETVRKQSGFRPTSAAPAKSAVPATDENPNHREDFTSLLHAAVKTPAQEDET